MHWAMTWRMQPVRKQQNASGRVAIIQRVLPWGTSGTMALLLQNPLKKPKGSRPTPVCGVTQTESIPALEPTEPEEPTEPSVPSTPVKPVWQSWLEKIFGDWWGDEEEECDHEYASVITEPTCEEKGYTTHTCTKCGDTYKDSYTDALGHQYEDGICTQCGKTEPVKPAKPNWKDILEMLLEWWK